MRRLALLFAGGALWLVLAALPASADGGPHQLAVNSGTAGLNGDCAACHRAHTAQAADLLKDDVPTLCTNCHNGTGATADVVNGIQYNPSGSGAPNTHAVLGALRGGGFSYALIDTSNATRLTYGGSQVITLTGATSGNFTLTFSGHATGNIAWNASKATVQAALVGLSNVGTDSGSYSIPTMYGTAGTSGSPNITVAGNNGGPWTVSFKNSLAVAAEPLITVTNISLNAGATSAVADTTQGAVRTTAAVGVLASAAAQHITSSHTAGVGNAWGNGPVGATLGATVVLDCVKCHNPHGNGQYRILNTLPGEDWSNGVNGTANWTAPANAVEVQDVGLTTSTKNYTVLPGLQATDVVAYGATAGDYFRKKAEPTGAYKWTNINLPSDPMNTGWYSITTTTTSSGSISFAYPTNAAGVAAYKAALTAASKTTDPISGVAIASIKLDNRGGLMTAWCLQCHTRYNGQKTQDGLATPSSLSDNSGGDPTYMFKHGTTGIGCEQCHVSHGSNALMTAPFASNVEQPDGTAAGTIANAGPLHNLTSSDSRLLKVDNFGTCNMCHDPTATVVPGTYTTSAGSGGTPPAPVPGP